MSNYQRFMKRFLAQHGSGSPGCSSLRQTRFDIWPNSTMIGGQITMHATHGCTDSLPITAAIPQDAMAAWGNSLAVPQINVGSKITIRGFQKEDSNELFEAVRESMEDLCAWMVWCRPDYSVEDCAAFIARCADDWETARQFSYAIIDASDGAFLGSVGLSAVNTTHRFANLGYWVRTSKGGRGIASSAVRLLSRLALEHGDFARLEILVPVGNLASQRVAEKSGAKREGVLRQRIRLNGACHDAIMYSLVNGDLR